MNSVQKKLKNLPLTPGIYLFKNDRGEVIYIGKAASLKKRVSSYWQTSHLDLKTPLLLAQIVDLNWIETDSEIEAIFLESEYIKRYKPVFNAREKDDKNFIYLKITTQEGYPIVSFVRRPNDDRATYFGPFAASQAVRVAMKYLRRIFPYFTSASWQKASLLEQQIGLAPPPDISKGDYRKNIQRLLMVLRGQSKQLVTSLASEMKRSAKQHRFEQATIIRNQLAALKALSQKKVFGQTETFDLSLDAALSELARMLGLGTAPRRIEAYDISNFAGKDAVASMIVFSDGLPNLDQYRRFRMHTSGPDDFKMIEETLSRRFKKTGWPRPDLILVDGGKGQLTSALKVLAENGIKIATVGLAKRYEQIIQQAGWRNLSSEPLSRSWHEKTSGNFRIIDLPQASATLQLLQRIRDEAHRFAVTYHMLVRRQRVKASWLDQIPGVGPATRKKLVKEFGSVSGVKAASEQELANVIGKKAKMIRENL